MPNPGDNDDQRRWRAEGGEKWVDDNKTQVTALTLRTEREPHYHYDEKDDDNTNKLGQRRSIGLSDYHAD